MRNLSLMAKDGIRNFRDYNAAWVAGPGRIRFYSSVQSWQSKRFVKFSPSVAGVNRVR
jgi:hypothetical protein